MEDDCEKDGLFADLVMGSDSAALLVQSLDPGGILFMHMFGGIVRVSTSAWDFSGLNPGG